MSLTSSDFFLRKWYMDCIDEVGNLFMGYSGSFRWKMIQASYSSTLTCNAQGEIKTASTLRELSHPTRSEGTLQWIHNKLKTTGHWTSIDKAIRQNIFSDKSGSIIWTCEQPRAIAEVEINNISLSSAIGYTETIDMTILPWRLPISKLRWGRFLSKNTMLIWIILEGKHTSNFVYYNGNRIADATIKNNKVVLNNKGITLRFYDTIVLRDGSLASTLFSDIPVLSKMIPTEFLNSHESKWRSRGDLLKNGKIVDSAWAIHEVVSWGR